MGTALQMIGPEEAQPLLGEGAILVDVREDYEVAFERIAGAVALPLSELMQGFSGDLPANRTPIFFCASGARTQRNQAALAEVAAGPAYGLVGGLVAWRRAGFPTEHG